MSQDKDELARQLAAMADAADAPQQSPDQVDLTQQPLPAAPTAPRMLFPDTGSQAQRATPQPRPLTRAALQPPPSMPATQAPSSSRPNSPVEVYYTPPTPRQPTAAAPFTAPVDDDAVIVPAPSPEVFAPRPALRPPVRQHTVQTLAFKRTIIPILLTLGVLCPVLGLLGFFVASTSPLSVLRSAWFSVPFVLIGLLNLAFAYMTMMQVKHELARLQQPSSAPNVR